MSKQPRIKIINHRAGDTTMAEIREATEFAKKRLLVNSALTNLQAQASSLVSRVTLREQLPELRAGLRALQRLVAAALQVVGSE